MGATKTAFFNTDQNTIAGIMKALAHPARIAIMEYLMRVDTCICGDIVEELPLSQPTISQHLKELKTAGLINGSVEGNSICYCINAQAIEKIQSYFGDIINQLKKKNNQCC